MRTAGLGAAAAAVCVCALFFSGGESNATIVWIGALALLIAATGWALSAPAVDGRGTLALGGLAGLTVWAGLSTVWSASPDASWIFTNRTLVFLAFALAGAVAGGAVSRAALARGAAVLLALLFGWALLAKCVPALYPDYDRIARLRSPVAYWNELALLGATAMPVALWLASAAAHGRRVRAAATVLVFGAALVTCLTVSRFGIALAILAAAAWIVLDDRRVESLAALVLGGGAAAAVFGVALALPGITNDAQPRSVRTHDGAIFAGIVVLAALAVFAVAYLASRRAVAEPSRRRIERIAGIAALAVALAGLAVSIVFAHRIWREFTNPVSTQVSQGPARLTTASSSNRWRWWVEAWHAFTRHPVGGTGAGTFRITDLLLHDSTITTDEPHNVPLQLLSETGIVGLLLYLTMWTGAALCVLRARVRERGPATALGLSLTAFAAHTIVDFDWSFVATCGPLLFVLGALAARPAEARAARLRPLAAVAAAAFALVGIYSIASPWLAQRKIDAAEVVAATSLTRAIHDLQQAHTYDPLSVQALTDRADFEDLAGDPIAARAHYEQALRLEPQSTEAWYAFGIFWWNHKNPKAAYVALNNAYTYDPFGRTSTHCGYLDFARRAVFGKKAAGPVCHGTPRR